VGAARPSPQCESIRIAGIFSRANHFQDAYDSQDMTAMELQLEPVPTYEKPAASSDSALIAAAIALVGAVIVARNLPAHHLPVADQPLAGEDRLP